MLNRLNLKTKIFIIVSIILVLLILPLTVFISLKQQTIRQRASNEPLVYLQMTPQNDTKNLGEEFSSNLNLFNPKGEDISAVDVTISYNSDVLSLVNFQPEQFAFSQIINDTTTPGKIHYVAVNKTSSPLKNVLFTLGTLTFKGKVPETGSVSFSDIKVAVANHPNPLPLDQNNNKEAQYMITSPKLPDSASGGKPLSSEDAPASSTGGVPTPIPSPTNSVTETPTATPMPIPTSLPSSTRLRNCEESTYSICMTTGKQPEGWAIYPSSTYVFCPAGQTCYYNPAAAP